MPESKTHRVWLILDELPQLGRVQGIDGIIDTGRSKGVCVVLGFQTKAKIEDIYGAAFADALLGNLGTQIFCRSGSAETRAWASDQIGQQEVRRVMESRSSDATMLQTRNRITGFNRTEQIVTQPVVFDTDLAGLGRRGDGIDAILVTGSDDYVAKVWWPFAQGWQRTAKPNAPADWTQAYRERKAESEEKPITTADTVDTDPPSLTFESPVPPPVPTSVPILPLPQGEGDFASFWPSTVDTDVAVAESDQAEADEAVDAVAHHAVIEAVDVVLPGAKLVVEAVEAVDSLTESASTQPVAPIQTPPEEPVRKKIRVRKKSVEHEQGA